MNLLDFFGAAAALAGGSLILSFVYEAIANNESFSLPFANIFFVVLIGIGFFVFFGFVSSGIVLGIYGTWCVLAGLEYRSS